MTPDDIDTLGRIVTEFGERVELFGRLVEKNIELDGMKAANRQHPQDEPYTERDFGVVAEETNRLLK